MPELVAALDAVVQEHRRCGELDGGVEGDRVWMSGDVACRWCIRCGDPRSLAMARERDEPGIATGESVVEHGHPGRGDRDVGGFEIVDLGALGGGPHAGFPPHRRYPMAPAERRRAIVLLL
jgi:hypothetical protein